MRSPNIRYLPAVDQLRACAALLILVYHGLHVFSYQARFGRDFGIDHWLHPANPLLAALAEGHTAVALFMVLSGFILTAGALEGGVTWTGFIRNRLLRTYPLFLLVVFAGVAMAPEHFTSAAFLQTVFGMANLPGALVAPPFTSMLWTIAIEWQFYLVFPLLVPVLSAAWTRRVLGLIALLLVLRVAAVIAGGNPREIGYMHILGRLDQFLMGMWAMWFWRAYPLSRRAGLALATAASVAIVAALAAFNAAGGWPATQGWKVVWPDLEAALWVAFLLGYLACANDARGLAARLFARVGEVSYSIYLLHFVVIWSLLRLGLPFAVTGRPVVDALLNTVLVASPLTLSLAALSYRCVERPFLSLRGQYHRDTSKTPVDAV